MRQSKPVCLRCGEPVPHGARKWCSENCRKRASDERHRGQCIDCGAALGSRSGWTNIAKPTKGRCVACDHREKAQRRRERIELVARLYNDGKKYREIAQALGYGANSLPPEVVEARKAGLIGRRNRRRAAA